tara:strand:- start:51 stop:428 length:378 start_codon:yes stop_codon:yes gene_type:complete
MKRKRILKEIKALIKEYKSLNESELKKGKKVTIAKDVKYYDGEFEEIVLTNGYKLTADEDTGGEGAYASIDGVKLKKGDVISFNRNVGGDTEYFDEDTIIVNGKKYTMSITAAGGNEGTILDYDR